MYYVKTIWTILELKVPSQVILGCVELTIKERELGGIPNIHTFCSDSCWKYRSWVGQRCVLDFLSEQGVCFEAAGMLWQVSKSQDNGAPDGITGQASCSSLLETWHEERIISQRETAGLLTSAARQTALCRESVANSLRLLPLWQVQVGTCFYYLWLWKKSQCNF